MDSEPLFTQFDSVFFEKTRLSVLTMLYKEERVSFNRLKKIIGGTDGALYTHIQKLQEVGYIDQDRKITGNKVHTIYTLTTDGKKMFRKYLSFMEQFIRKNRKK